MVGKSSEDLAFRAWLVGALALSVLAAQAFLIGLGDAFHLCGSDLPNRIWGARAAWAGFDPYFHHALKDVPQSLRLPGDSYPGVSSTTVAPTFLLLLGPVAHVDYLLLRPLWWALGWALLIACVALAWRMAEDRQQRRGLILLGLMIAASYFWRLHGERGQYYILVAFCLAVENWMVVRRPGRLSGWALGVAIAIRPTLVATLPVVAFAAGWRVALRAAALAGMLFTITVVLWGTDIWIQYAANASEWFHQAVDPEYFLAKYGETSTVAAIGGCDSLAIPALTAMPTLPVITRSDAAFYAGTPLMLTGGLLLAWYARSLRQQSTARAWALVPFLAAATDFLVPVRIGYADVMFLPALAAMAQALAEGPDRRTFLAGALAALATSLPFFESGLSTMIREYVLLILLGSAAVALSKPQPADSD